MGENVSVQFHRSSKCLYFSDRRERFVKVDLINISSVDRLSEFRALTETGVFHLDQNSSAYCKACSGCQNCVPLRINLDLYQHSKRDRRILRKNEEVSAEIIKMSEKTDKEYRRLMNLFYGIYSSFRKHRFADDSVKTLSQFEDTVSACGDEVMILNDDRGSPLSIEIITRGPDFIIAQECYYRHASLYRSPGHLSLLKLMEFARQQGKHYLLLGDWAADVPRLEYKTSLRAVEAYTEHGWQPFDPKKHTQGPDYAKVLASKGYDIAQLIR